MKRTPFANPTRLPLRLLILISAGLLPAGPAAAAPKDKPAVLQLRTEHLLELQKRFAELSDDLPEARKLGMDRITAYEESAHFAYVEGPVGAWTRRVVLLKPGVFVVDDLGPKGGQASWRIITRAAPKIQGTTVTCTGADDKLRSWRIMPHKADVSCAPEAGNGRTQAHMVSVGPAAGQERYVHVLKPTGEKDMKFRAAMASPKDPVGLSVTHRETTFELVLPPRADTAGTIAAASGDKALLARRLLPSGIMPHGAEGAELLERWDKSYRGRRVPGWDANRVATQLKRAVEQGKVRPGKALILGCGTGTNAIYLARKGFDVTGLEVAPTALTIAESKARRAGVKVRWIVADAANPPDMGTFDFVFDRGCYHHVRWVNREGYVEAVSRLTRPGGQFLLLSFRATDDRQGKPRVKESQIREDFRAGFEFTWLREMRFDSRSGVEKSAPAWTVLMKRRKPSTPGVLKPGAKLTKLADGFRFTEGPAADGEGNVLFTDIPAHRIHKWWPGGKVSVFRENSGRANGLAFDKRGNLLVCEGGNGRVVAIDAKGKVAVVAEKYEGKRFNQPNDLWIAPDGGVYFSDPIYGRAEKPQGGEHVYYVTPDRKKVIRVIDDMVRPNGLVGTRDGRTLYVADHGAGKTWRYAVNADGTLADKKLFAETGSDGMALDAAGNVYITAAAVLVFSPAGKPIGRIDVPQRPSNVCFGGQAGTTLFITARSGLYAVTPPEAKGP